MRAVPSRSKSRLCFLHQHLTQLCRYVILAWIHLIRWKTEKNKEQKGTIMTTERKPSSIAATPSTRSVLKHPKTLMSLLLSQAFGGKSAARLWRPYHRPKQETHTASTRPSPAILIEICNLALKPIDSPGGTPLYISSDLEQPSLASLSHKSKRFKTRNAEAFPFNPVNSRRHDLFSTDLADYTLMNSSWSRHLGTGSFDFEQILEGGMQDLFS